MKVKESSNISNRKKNALPSSKLLKPKKFKSSLMKSGDGNKAPLSKGKLKFVSENVVQDLKLDDNLENRLLNKPFKRKKHIEDLGLSSLKEQTAPKSRKSKRSLNETKTKSKSISKLFDFVMSLEQNKNDKVIGEGSPKKNDIKHDKMKKSTGGQHLSKPGLGLGLDDIEQKTGIKTPDIDKCKLKASNVLNIAKRLLKLMDETSLSKPEFLDVGELVYLQVECIKIPICPTKQLRFKLPHPLTDKTSDVLLITADLKGHKIYPDRAVDHYEELLAKHQINFITKVMPLRMVKQEYSQYELKRKLVDQFDVILADSRIIRSLPRILSKFAMYKHKMPIPVNLTMGEHKLKKHLQDAVCKTQMTVKSNGHCSVVQIGHSKMTAKEIATNIVEVAKSMEKLYPGGWRNVRSLGVKFAKSTLLPVYLSLLSPNEVKIPIETRKKPAPVEDELSTMPGYNVVVTADGNVILKKMEEDLKIDNSRDDEILEEAEKYLESSKTVRYDDSSDEEKNKEKEDSDSDDEGEAITEAMEKKLMNKYEKNAKARKNKKGEEEDQSGEEEEGEESEEESEMKIPAIGKKRKSQGAKKQSGPPAKKAFNSVKPKRKNKMVDKSDKESKKAASPGVKKPQPRGTRGGKKTKLSKDQRKALIKRKKAGKK